MNRTIFFLATLLLISVGFFLAFTAYNWSVELRELLYVPLWLSTVGGFVIYLVNERRGIYILIGLAMLWLVQIVEFWGWYVIFESANITMWSLYGLLLILCMVIVFSGTRITLQNHPRIRNSVRGIVLLIPVLGILSFSNKTYYRGLFAEFYEIDRTEFKVVFKPQPSDARQFEIRTSSNEVRNLVKDKATYDANHHYMPNVKLKINMTFKRINTIELYELADQELEQPVQRQLKQLKGATEFLK